MNEDKAARMYALLIVRTVYRVLPTISFRDFVSTEAFDKVCESLCESAFERYQSGLSLDPSVHNVLSVCVRGNEEETLRKMVSGAKTYIRERCDALEVSIDEFEKGSPFALRERKSF